MFLDTRDLFGKEKASVNTALVFSIFLCSSPASPCRSACWRAAWRGVLVPTPPPPPWGARPKLPTAEGRPGGVSRSGSLRARWKAVVSWLHRFWGFVSKAGGERLGRLAEHTARGAGRCPAAGYADCGLRVRNSLLLILQRETPAVLISLGSGNTIGAVGWAMKV